MTYTELLRYLDQKFSADQSPLKQLIDRCHNKPFWCNNTTHQNDCCTWSILIPPKGLDGKPSPLDKFHQNIISQLESEKRLAVVKARNLGMTALALRYALHLTLSKQIPGNYLSITGVGYILSTSLARRVRDILKPLNVFFDDNVNW